MFESLASVDNLFSGPAIPGLAKEVIDLELTRLRDATENHHRKLEEELDWLRPSFTRARYTALLRRFYGFHYPWERVVGAHLEPTLPGFFDARRKLASLESDLRFLGAHTEDLSQIRHCADLPQVKGVASALGSLYVVEGSSLGGQILSRHFARRLDIRPAEGGRFFSGYGERTGQMWSSFGGLLALRPEPENDEMIAAAISTFDSLGRWLTNNDSC